MINLGVPHMPKDTAGLEQSARRRGEQAMGRALAALQRMDAADQAINFRTVAAEAKVSTAWLYRQDDLRARIMRSPKTVSQMASPASASQLRERQSRQKYRDDASATDQGS